MRALKWVGYLIAATVVLAMVIGLGGFILLALTIAGALVCLIGAIWFIAALIKMGCEWYPEP